jgi:hypothetical protein
MRRFMFAAALSAALACLSLPLRAEKLTATVPFDFYIGQRALPAGDYQFDINRYLIQVFNRNGKGSAFTLTLPAERAVSRNEGLLVFNKIGEEYFLNQVWGPGNKWGCEYRKSAREKEAIANATRPGQVMVAVVPARRH